MKKTKIQFAVFFLFLFLFFGCINLGGPSDKLDPVKDTSKTQPKQEPKAPEIIIISKTNQTISAEKPIIVPPEVAKPKGIHYTPNKDAKFAVYFIYVGDPTQHGDAILVKKGDAEILIDAGPESNAQNVLTTLETLGVDDIELLISTHADPEHYGGIPTILDNYDVEEFWWSGYSYGNPSYLELISQVNAKEIPVKQVKYSDSFEINGFNLFVLNPPESENKFTDIDNNAIAIKLTDRDFCLMLNSDILYGAQIKLIQRSINLQCEIMQTPTHGLGLGNSQIDQLLLKVKPKVAIMSGGPSDITSTADKIGSRPAVREKLKIKGVVSVYENYLDGGKTVKITSDGQLYSVDYVN
ncbi:MBL fold metallo-hydrolase [Candidatus Micrarchaeota archaeon]|nr:MBL fold metallo-hydrolase [Candidatus Micrarchaeota archaeon]